MLKGKNKFLLAGIALNIIVKKPSAVNVFSIFYLKKYQSFLKNTAPNALELCHFLL